MPKPEFRDNFYEGVGGKHAYKTGTASANAAAVVAAVTGKKIRLKAFRFLVVDDSSGTPADVAVNLAWLADGSTAFLGLGHIGGKDVTFLSNGSFDSGLVTLPGKGLEGTAATALNIDFTATDTDVHYQLDVWYDEV